MIEQFEDTKWVIRIRISNKNRQHNGQKKKVLKDKQRSTKHTHKTKDRVTFSDIYLKKSLKIPKGQSESVYRTRTDNAMAKRKSTKGPTTIYKTYI